MKVRSNFPTETQIKVVMSFSLKASFSTANNFRITSTYHD